MSDESYYSFREYLRSLPLLSRRGAHPIGVKTILRSISQTQMLLPTAASASLCLSLGVLILTSVEWFCFNPSEALWDTTGREVALWHDRRRFPRNFSHTGRGGAGAAPRAWRNELLRAERPLWEFCKAKWEDEKITE